MYKNIPLLFVSLLLLSACSGSQSDVSSQESAFSEGAVVVTKEQFEASGMELASLQKIGATEEIEANGRIAVTRGHLSNISPLVEGRVRSVFVSRGDWVKRGDRLFVMEGPAIINLQKDYLDAAAIFPVLKSDFERQKGLLEEEVASQKVFEMARADFLAARAQLSALTAQMELFGVNVEQLEESGEIASGITVTAPISGNVTMQEVQQGMFLSAGEKVMEIIDSESVYVEMDVYEAGINGLSEGMEVLVHPSGDSPEEYEAKVVRVSRKVNPESRSISVHATLKEPAPALLPDMFVNARIQKNSGEMWMLPGDAVVDVENRKWVLVQEAENDSVYSFVRREVQTTGLIKNQTGIKNHEDFESNTLFLSKGAFGLIQ
jgi:cobalt-zinc-cadmium efflux system membrane fusion protein